MILNAKSIQMESGTFARPIEGIPTVFPAHIPKLSRLPLKGGMFGVNTENGEKGSVILHQ